MGHNLQDVLIQRIYNIFIQTYEQWDKQNYNSISNDSYSDSISSSINNGVIEVIVVLVVVGVAVIEVIVVAQ